MKKVITLIIVPILIVLMLITGIVLSPYIITKDLQKTLNVDFTTVDKVVICSGETGKHCDITDKEKIHEFLNNFDGAKLKKSFDQRQYTGFIYSVKLYKSDKIAGEFDFGYNIVTVYNNRKFIRYISNKNIDHLKIDEIAEQYNLNNLR